MGFTANPLSMLIEKGKEVSKRLQEKEDNLQGDEDAKGCTHTIDMESCGADALSKFIGELENNLESLEGNGTNGRSESSRFAANACYNASSMLMRQGESRKHKQGEKYEVEIVN